MEEQKLNYTSFIWTGSLYLPYLRSVITSQSGLVISVKFMF
jgi:hypothetical protein